jgi:PAS domain S-box-containing protein
MQLDLGIGNTLVSVAEPSSWGGPVAIGGQVSTGGASGDMTSGTRDAKQSSEAPNLRDLIEMIPGLVMCALPDGSAEFANRAWQEYAGCSSEQLMGWGWQTVIHPDDVTKFKSKWSASPTAEKPFETEARMRRADGQYHWFSIRKGPVVSETRSSKALLRTLIAFEDINERKEAQVKLQLSEALQQAFCDNSPNLIWLEDRQGRYLYANKEFQSALRVTEEQVKGKKDEELFLVKQAAAFQAKNLQVLETRARVRFEDVFFREDGQRALIVQKFPLFDADGVVYAIGSVATDITERQHEESARRYSEENHRLVVETANDAIISMDHTGTIQFANPASTRIFGYDPAELIGEPLTVLMPKFMRELHDNGFRRYLDTGQRHINWQGTELTALRKNGQEFPVEISFGELTRDGHKIFTGFIRDISKRKQAEDQLRASERTLQMTQAELARVSRLTTMGEMAASIAHEVNQPLTAVVNNSSACLRLLANRNLEPDILRQALEGIIADGTRASAVLSRIRAFIKKEAAEKSELNVSEVIQEVLTLAGRELYENQVLLEKQLTNDLPSVLADRVQLQQVLLNLIMNGIEAMTAVKDRPRLLGVQSRIDPSGDVLVAVSDSGTGFDTAVERAFTPFFTTKANGLGMGLSISRSLVEGHGGRLWATHNSPYGAVFSFTLPTTGGNLS